MEFGNPGAGNVALVIKGSSSITTRNSKPTAAGIPFPVQAQTKPNRGEGTLRSIETSTLCLTTIV